MPFSYASSQLGPVCQSDPSGRPSLPCMFSNKLLAYFLMSSFNPFVRLGPYLCVSEQVGPDTSDSAYRAPGPIHDTPFSFFSVLAPSLSVFVSQCSISLCPSMQNLAGSALFLPQGGTHFQLVPLGSPQGYFMSKFSPLTNIKFLHPMPPVQK